MQGDVSQERHVQFISNFGTSEFEHIIKHIVDTTVLYLIYYSRS